MAKQQARGEVSVALSSPVVFAERSRLASFASTIVLDQMLVSRQSFIAFAEDNVRRCSHKLSEGRFPVTPS
jgi:hypothetical protein